jgi:23S rRNA G2445 N2-methylase RlmL
LALPLGKLRAETFGVNPWRAHETKIIERLDDRAASENARLRRRLNEINAGLPAMEARFDAAAKNYRRLYSENRVETRDAQGHLVSVSGERESTALRIASRELRKVGEERAAVYGERKDLMFRLGVIH